MGIYILLPPVVLLLGYLTKAKIKFKCKQFDSEKLYLFCVFILFVLVMGLRSTKVGTDNSNYTQLFIRIGRAPFYEAITKIITSAPVYSFYCKIIYLICPNPVLWSMCNAAIICGCAVTFFYYFSENVVCSVYCFISLYFYLSSFNITRQYLAISLVLLAACLVIRRKEKCALLAILLAIGIHNLAFIICPFLIFLYIKITQKRAALFLICGAGGAILFRLVFERYILLFIRIFPRYAMYLGSSRHNVFKEIGRGNNLYLRLFYLAILIVPFCWIIFNKTGAILPKKLEKILAIAFIGCVMGACNSSNLALSRVACFFELFMCCVIPNTIELFGRWKKILYFICYFLLIIPYGICLNRNLSGVVPYIPMWQ